MHEATPPKYYSQSELSRLLGYPSKRISDAVARATLDPSRWLLAGGRRLIPESEVEAIRQALATDRRRKRPQPQATPA
jgi:hypothetical protein